jgi:hypothetical protein
VSRVAPNRIDRPGTAEEAWDEWAIVAHFTRPLEVLLR